MERAAGVVAMGGYNTFCEILSFDKRALIVPRTTPRLEQYIRASRAAERALVPMLVIRAQRDPRARSGGARPAHHLAAAADGRRAASRPPRDPRAGALSAGISLPRAAPGAARLAVRAPAERLCSGALDLAARSQARPDAESNPPLWPG